MTHMRTNNIRRDDENVPLSLLLFTLFTISWKLLNSPLYHKNSELLCFAV